MRLNIGSKYCLPNFKKLGLVSIDSTEVPTIEYVNSLHKDVTMGGLWNPSGCLSQQKVAVVVPYRDRRLHLHQFLARIHQLLKRQMLDYQIFIVEQVPGSDFNRAMLMNVGYLEALRLGNFDCFVFHDVDVLPENDLNFYMCDDNARHLASAIDEMRYRVMYENYVGAVLALSTDNMEKVNGFANVYWGWGNEDDDMSARVKEAGLLIVRPPVYIGRYKMARHVKNTQFSSLGLFWSWIARWRQDGLNSLRRKSYTSSATFEPLYTNISVDIGEPPPISSIDVSETVSLLWFLQFYGYLP